MDTRPQSFRDRIVTYAETAKDQEGQSYRESAEKLGISPSTLYRYRKGRTKPSKRIQDKMNRGGKLTQLQQNLTPEGETPEDLRTSTDEFMDRPQFPDPFAQRLGEGQLADFSEVEDRIEVTVTARQFQTEDGSTEWRIGPPEGAPGELVDTKEKTFTLGRVQDQRHLAGMVAPWLAEEGIIYSASVAGGDGGVISV
jgi:transcriptional regulator with XRE-family HTH domain